MRFRLVWALPVLGALALLAWRQELFVVSPGADGPRPLVLVADSLRHRLEFDVTLPAAPIGRVRVQSGGTVQVVHYWAPWEHDARTQAHRLDSLRTMLTPGRIHVAIVCFDPFPSVARWVRRAALRTPVLLDHGRLLSDALPCASIPYTWVIDRGGRVAVSQAGEVDWLAPATRALLDSLGAEPATHEAPALPL